MSWFHYTKLERLKRNREIRCACAEQVRKTASENIFLLPDLVKDAVRSATDEDRMFEASFGEPLPQQLATALRAELTMWEHINQAVLHAHKQQLSESDYDHLRDRIIEYSMILVDVLHAEEEMVTSCLVRHYLTVIDALADKAARVEL